MAEAVQDNRESCSSPLPSGCVPYTGYVSDTISEDLICRPNINDVFKILQDSIDKINKNLGDNTTLDKNCLTDANIPTITQAQLNQIFINQLCTLNAKFGTSGADIDPNLISLTVSLLCLESPSCEPKTAYTLPEIINKLITNYCSLLTRIQKIEQTLNL